MLHVAVEIYELSFASQDLQARLAAPLALALELSLRLRCAACY